MRALFAGAIALFLTSCMLVTPSIDAGDHCGFAGTSACAACLRKSCQPAIDACCNAEECRDESTYISNAPLAALDACGNGPATTCAEKVKSVRKSTAADAMFGCLQGSCRTECVGDAPVPWSCQTPRDSEQACAQCIYTSCGTALDACCADSTCNPTSDYLRSPVLEQVGACVSGDEPGCAYVATQSTAGKDGVVRACITSKCATACFGNGRPHQSCSLQNGGLSCACSDADKASGDECSTSTVTGTCAVAKAGCICGGWSCEPSSFGCQCTFDGEANVVPDCTPASSRSKSGKCCLELGDQTISCRCEGQSSCYTSQFEVSSCEESVATAALQRANRITTRCSQ